MRKVGDAKVNFKSVSFSETEANECYLGEVGNSSREEGLVVIECRAGAGGAYVEEEMEIGIYSWKVLFPAFRNSLRAYSLCVGVVSPCAETKASKRHMWVCNLATGELHQSGSRKLAPILRLSPEEECSFCAFTYNATLNLLTLQLEGRQEKIVYCVQSYPASCS